MSEDDTFVGDDASEFFAILHGRRRNVLNDRYMLPADEDEIRRYSYHHRILQFVFEGRNYVGPVKEVLTYPGVKHKRRVLDVGTGGGLWAVEMADEFPRVEVTGVDVAPIQPREVPPNCSFELCDLDHPTLPYLTQSYDIIHARSMHTGIGNYQQFVNELTRMLRPGGVLILIEPDSQPVVDGHLLGIPPHDPYSSVTSALGKRPHTSYASGAPGWFALWEAYRTCLQKKGIDVNVPSHLGAIIRQTEAYDQIRVQEATIPIGFWPKDVTLLTIGQLAWMEYDHLLPAMRPMLLEAGLPEWKVKVLVEDAHRDMYEPVMPPSVRLHVVHAIKK
ncbi:S-adenosyl-L-methionine-dependent methyltransferase [Neolentinus lepideus HHB14362 ss-1]|uniref:S-adenosyl-L-methionine-dependent methyltransferase n=1 Tax=Neolentinus lepideus HHB14362 ss-1 TaxID=1314782 RepID=A0A165TDV2_9AGAM|nr:S-adenosyl-L-methionine-dependent methyltransferase [Neolentinus lepideus HHB14362 ss-1]